ncbi:putative Spindle-pole body protein [Taphrina deformans PYCC 5710]|uniref:Spindle-pole body protein n=1 Tax=Taphrina deformans (strain PYCC 5710 / ATCC 11124 / CBS 356.35 / IMI 108563 / JCM 9778 / NBRC 8474) TaxID=1097556 RepID=R4X6F5_TAPDE|nr:putative Spindle-pole body protein [Taphrina deformans PYCC 5710]|eukprot:CCG80674.1 putative Spindle-pole body protein [Taphrina deformans PYCC 5710]
MKFVDFLTSHDSLQQEKENVRPTVQQRSKQEHANLDSTASVGDAARQRMMDNCAQNLQLPTEPDQLPDISYEQSFLPPTSGVESSLIGHNNNIGDSHSSLNEQDATPSRPDRLTNNLYARQEEPREVNPDLSPDIFMSPVPTNVKEWETPAATKQYMNDLPTRTAIARRVESFQIPPERLAALQPEIVAMQNQNRKPSDKLSLKESSAQIDALLNENWGLKMKIMFMDQHFEQDREKAELIAENVRLQTNGFNFVQQVKARDKTIRSLQKQVEDLEFRHAGLTSSCHELQVEPEECINQKIQELEHYIDILEQEHDKVVLNLETNLGNATRKLEELDVSQVSENHPNLEHEAHSDELVYNEMRTSLMEAEAEIRDLEEEFRFRIAELEDTIADRDRDVVDYRAKLLDISESLKSCEIDLAKSDRLRQDTIEEIRDIYESERVEYELYIEDRHEEIDNLKQAIKSYNQDSFEARLKEALKPHQKAWLDLNRQYDETREEAERQEALHRSKLQEVSRQLEHRADNQRHLVADLRKLEMQLRHKEDILAELRLSVIPTKHSDDDGKDGTSTQQDAASTDKQFPLQQNALEEQREKNFALLTEIHSRQELLSLLQEELEEARGENKALAAQSELDSRKLSDLEELCQQYQDQIIDLSAEVDNAKHAAERLEHDMTKQVEKDRNVIENLKQDHRKQQESDAAHSAELELQLARASDNLDSIRSTMMEFFNPDTGDDLGTALQDYLNRMQAECLELHESVEKLTVAHKSITSERDESERGANDRHNEIKLLKANLSRTVSEKENLESQIHKLESQLLAARSSLSEVQNNTTEAHRVLEKSLQRRSQLSIQFILKLRSMLGDTNGRNKFDSIMDDHNEIKSAFQGLIQELSKRLQEHHSSAGPRTIDMEKRIEELEALLDVRLTTEEAKQTELQQVRDELESLRTLQKNSLPTKAQGATGFKRQELTRKPSLLESISKTSGEEYWTLHERIRVLTQDLKYQKELREQDDKAAKSRLAEAKREKRTLQDIRQVSMGEVKRHECGIV